MKPGLAIAMRLAGCLVDTEASACIQFNGETIDKLVALREKYHIMLLALMQSGEPTDTLRAKASYIRLALQDSLAVADAVSIRVATDKHPERLLPHTWLLEPLTAIDKEVQLIVVGNDKHTKQAANELNLRYMNLKDFLNNDTL